MWWPAGPPPCLRAGAPAPQVACRSRGRVLRVGTEFDLVIVFHLGGGGVNLWWPWLQDRSVPEIFTCASFGVFFLRLPVVGVGQKSSSRPCHDRTVSPTFMARDCQPWGGGEKAACLLGDLDRLRTFRGNRPDRGACAFLLQVPRQREGQGLDVPANPLPHKGWAASDGQNRITPAANRPAICGNTGNSGNTSPKPKRGAGSQWI